jgi:hypothetical protein
MKKCWILVKNRIIDILSKEINIKLEKEIKKREKLEFLLGKILLDKKIKLPFEITLEISKFIQFKNN